MGAFLALKPNALQKPAKLVFGMIVTSFTSCHHVRMKIGPYIGCAVLVMVFGSAIFGILIRHGSGRNFDGLSSQPVDRHGKWYFQYQESGDHIDSR